MAKKRVVKRKTASRKTRSAKGFFETHPNAKWLLPLMVLSYLLFLMVK